jgi:carboxylesterase type B
VRCAGGPPEPGAAWTAPCNATRCGPACPQLEEEGRSLRRRAARSFVAINYRLGALGLSQRVLAAVQCRDVLPAVGLLDQRAALQWVQRNIAEG